MDEIKRITCSFCEKSAGLSPIDVIQSTFTNIENRFKKCNEELAAAGMPECSYAFQPEAISEVVEDMVTLFGYTQEAHSYVHEELDMPLYKDFKNHATESLSQIILDEITTDNTFGMEEHVKVDVDGTPYIYKQVKGDLKFSDFLGLPNVSPEDGYPVLENVETMGEFASLFRADYDRMKPEGMSVNAYLEGYLSYGEYDHKAYHPVADFLSGLLDITIIKPIIECITGEDLITGERLTDFERGMKLAGAVVDLFTLGQAVVLTKGAGLGVSAVVKTIGLELLSNASAYTVGYAGDAMGAPLPVTWILSVAAGGSVSWAGGKYIYKGANGVVKELTAEEIEGLLKNADDMYGGARVADNLADISKYLDDVNRGGTGVRGKLTGSLDGLTSDERTVINELLDAGKDVEIIPRSNIQNAQTADFYVNGVKTEFMLGSARVGNDLADISKYLDDVNEVVKELDISKYLDDVNGGGSKTVFNTTPELEAHIKSIDPSVPRRRGIGGAHNSTEFFKNDVEIISETPSKIPGVKTVEYKMPKLNADGTPTGEYGARVFKKTIYDPEVISDDEFIKRGIEAANDAISKTDDGVMPREWSGVDSEGITWHGYFEDGEITSFFPDE